MFGRIATFAPMSNQRLDYLDSIRGIAALTTLVGHWLHMFKPDQGIPERTRQWLDFAVCGADGVSMFFVLSGLVLSLKYLRREGDMGLNYAEFLVNRFFRIYPACFVVLLFYFYSAHEQDAQGNFLWRWLWGPNLHFWEEASLVRNVSQYFGPVWTLNVEVMLSVIVPLLLLLVRYRPRWFKYVWLISIFWTSFYSMFVFHFMCGIWIAAHFEDIRQFDFKKSKLYPWRWAIYVGIYLLYAMREWMDFVKPGDYWHYWSALLGFNVFHFTGLGAALILVKVIQSERLQGWLSLRPLLFLGRISYGIYIVHWYFLFNVLQHRYWGWRERFALSDTQVHLLIGAAALVLTLAAATVLHYAVEKPFIRWGRVWAARAKARFA